MTIEKNEHNWIRETARKLRIIKDKGGVCSKCGLDGMKSPWLIDLHHIDPSKKTMSPNKMYDYSLKDIQKELENCMLLCANCHREHHNITYKERYTRLKESLDTAIEVAHLDFDEEREKKNDLIDSEVTKLIKKGMTYREISKIMNVSPAAIHKYVKRANLESNFVANKPGKVTDIVLKKILELKSIGMTSRDIGKELKLSKTTVLNHWHTHQEEIPSSVSSSSPTT